MTHIRDRLELLLARGESMTAFIDVDALLASAALPKIDVRSPREFSRGHIPGAKNVPLFDDNERAEIGTIYKQVGRNPAVERGMEIAESKSARLIESVRSITSGPELILHCWRGGMRSAGFAWLLEQAGFQPRLLEGGYKAFRRAARQCFSEPRRVVILGGHTGAGKTHLLGALRQAGEKVIDLEGLACHRGSTFGGIGQPPQPTVEQFENELFLQWRALGDDQTVWIEGESKSIGRIYIPDAVWNQMRDAPAIFIEVDRARRVEFLIQEYGQLSVEQLKTAVVRIKKRLGGNRLQAALQALEQQDLRTFVGIALEYYDKAYTNALKKRPRSLLVRLPLIRAAQVDAVEKLQELAKEFVSTSPRASGPNPRACS